MSIAILMLLSATSSANPPQEESIPVIFDTDIGDDIDDTWALALLLKCPELDVKLITTDKGKGIYRAKLVAKLLEIAGRTDLPIGIGHGSREGTGAQQPWVDDYHLDSYPGTVLEDGVKAMINRIMQSAEPITVIGVGPVPSIAEALRREPRVAEQARFIGMYGSIRKGYGESDEISAEWNVRADPKSCRAVLSAPWDITITPLDTCGLVQLRDEKFARIRDSKDPVLEALIENYYIWAEKASWFAASKDEKRDQSSTLFDTVAVYLAITDKLCTMETLPIRVTDEGMTVVDQKAKQMRVATEWRDLPAFEDWLVERLTREEKD